MPLETAYSGDVDACFVRHNRFILAKQVLLVVSPSLTQCSCLATHDLTHLFFFITLYRDSHFFSFNRTSEEISLILDEDTVMEFPENSLVVVRTPWRALSVSFGSVGYSACFLVMTATLS